MKRKTMASIFFMTLPILILSCKKEKADTEKPAIKMNSPTEDAEYKAGETIVFNATFTDNIALSEYDIDIHNGAGHGHGRMMGVWAIEISGELSGIMHIIKKEINIPNDADTGTYHMIVNALDKAGNEAEFEEIDFKIIL
ncbi:MAG: DUF4625 domain-containing protein [Bacteroidetes bacterium]|nr:DUF4625 domain-containing protein [Bacteroidota bacterium]MBV6461643.1 hypothetical protein [Flavobacteriales bacterium]WKZ74121.1 MAG: DUF4625 domain-containing protein [Vicingaceae bacterium]MCL4816794.1 DUF4625 domain-containing protein [Flavobacteriales bacterium]NOG95732.1 DUF4625 domain-containing protein [Bacteroidota bacterium]